MNKNKEGKPKALIITAAITSVLLLLGFATIIISSLFLPKNNNLDAYHGIEREVAEMALTQRPTGPTIFRSTLSISSVKLTELNGKCNDTIGMPAGDSLPAQRYEVALSEMGITGLFAPPILIHVCIY